MIDIESEIYGPISKTLREEFPKISVSGEYVRSPSTFPHVTIEESDNYTSQDKLSSSDREEYSSLLYTVNVYSNKTSGKKAECRKIMARISELLYAKNFRRISCTPVPNMQNATIYRLVAQFVVETDGTTLYRR